MPYYVKDNFHSEYQGSLRRLELSVEEEYLTNLRHNCYREKNYSEIFAYLLYIIYINYFYSSNKDSLINYKIV